jgi:hypothetical protein
MLPSNDNVVYTVPLWAAPFMFLIWVMAWMAAIVIVVIAVVIHFACEEFWAWYDRRQLRKAQSRGVYR